MPIPILASVGGFVGKLFGNVFGPKGKARRAARRARRAASGKKGLFGGFFKNIFGRKRNKGQKLADRAQALLDKNMQTNAKLKAQMEEAARKSGAGSLQEWLDSKGSASGSLPFNLAPNLIGLRGSQQFQLPPDVKEAFDSTKAKFALDEPRNGAKPDGIDVQTILIVGGVIVVVVYIATR